MAITIVRHRVTDYEAWRAAFDAFELIRKAGGELSATVVQVEADPRDVVVIETWSSLGAARSFIGSPELASAMENAGVTTPPEVIFGTES